MPEQDIPTKITTNHLDIMLSMPVTIVSFNRERIMTNNRPSSRDPISKSYTVRLQFQNTTIETDIKEGDPRFADIEKHCILHDIMR